MSYISDSEDGPTPEDIKRHEREKQKEHGRKFAAKMHRHAEKERRKMKRRSRLVSTRTPSGDRMRNVRVRR